MNLARVIALSQRSWRGSNCVPPGRMYRAIYEGPVRNPDAEMHRMLDHHELPFGGGVPSRAAYFQGCGRGPAKTRAMVKTFVDSLGSLPRTTCSVGKPEASPPVVWMQ